jgi:hypothetical protein
LSGKFDAAFDDGAERRQPAWGSDKDPTAVMVAVRNNEANHGDDDHVRNNRFPGAL